jgi:hypothetical protein
VTVSSGAVVIRSVNGGEAGSSGVLCSAPGRAAAATAEACRGCAEPDGGDPSV